MLVRGYQSWWVWGARACAAIFFGLLELFYPAPTLFLAVLLYGAFTKIDGLLSIIIAAHWLRTSAAAPLFAAGAVGVLSGMIALIWSTLEAQTMSLTLGIAAIVRGSLEAIHATRIRQQQPDRRPAFIAGLLISAYGIVILLGPLIGLPALVMAFAVYTTAAGACYSFTAIRLRNLERATPARSQPEIS